MKKSTDTETLHKRLKQVNVEIHKAARQHQRQTSHIELLAVSKKHTVAEIKAVHSLGQKAFGENYVDEAEEKIAATRELDICWHFIGPIQSNKTRRIATTFDWVHTIDRLKIAQRLNEQRPEKLPALNVCIQVNIDREPTKSGVEPESLTALAEAVEQLPHLRLRGLMAIPQAQSDFQAQRSSFAKLRVLAESLNEKGFTLDTLSMGMSADFEAAIAEGSTIVRLGTSIFGPRKQ